MLKVSLQKLTRGTQRPSSDLRGLAIELFRLGIWDLEVSGARVLAAAVDAPDAKALLDAADRVKGRLKDAAILLGTAADGRVHLVASVSPALVRRGVKAGSVVNTAAAVVGGGGGGRDTMAQAGGRDPDKLEEAIDAGRRAIESALAG